MANTPQSYNFFPSFKKEQPNKAPDSSSVLTQAEQVNLRVQSLLKANQDTTPEQSELIGLLEQAMDNNESVGTIAQIQDMLNRAIDPTLSPEFEERLEQIGSKLEAGFDIEDPEVLPIADYLNEQIERNQAA